MRGVFHLRHKERKDKNRYHHFTTANEIQDENNDIVYEKLQENKPNSFSKLQDKEERWKGNLQIKRDLSDMPTNCNTWILSGS